MKTEKLAYHDGDVELEAHVACDGAGQGKRPVVLVAHAWAGQSDVERSKAEDLAKLGYLGVALDVYGKGVLGSSKDENGALMQPFLDDRARLQRRLAAGLEAARGHGLADTNRIAAIGFCFGGLCVLDMARSGADMRGVVSFHGLLFPPEGDRSPDIKAKILALHGYNDPMVKPDSVVSFASEMTQAGADWQVHMYGNTMHAFTNPAADDPGFGTVYNRTADERSWATMCEFLREIFAD